jgi:Mg-chelatase subunit ChlD
MDKKRSRITYLLVAGTLCLVAWAASAMPKMMKKPDVLTTTDPEPKPEPKPEPIVTVPKARPKIEVVFALDTTGSMSGLIEGAKRKIWSIATFIAQGNPKPELRIGLVAYRDKGDEYVTRFYDLSDDLDKVFAHLSAFEAAGGGDTPEHVAKALHDAVNRASWTSDQNVLKQVYLVGDAPPHTDYGDFDYRKIAQTANDKGIHINTVRCGSDRQTQLVWNEIARVASGEFASIDQSGGMIAVATPYDDQLAALNAKLVGTAIGYGRWRGEVRSKASAAAAMPAPAAADRASYFGLAGGGSGVGGEGDLARDVKSGKVRLDDMPAAEIPAEMAGLDKDGRRKFVEEKNAERERVTSEINTLAIKRNEYLKTKKKADAFDTGVENTIKAQAKSIGVAW